MSQIRRYMRERKRVRGGMASSSANIYISSIFPPISLSFFISFPSFLSYSPQFDFWVLKISHNRLNEIQEFDVQKLLLIGHFFPFSLHLFSYFHQHTCYQQLRRGKIQVGSYFRLFLLPFRSLVRASLDYFRFFLLQESLGIV